MVINRQDTNGTKALLQTGELGYDNYPGGGDKGRVYVGDGTINVALAKKSEVDAKVIANANITAGTYKSVTVDVKGLVTEGTNPTTLGGYGITDAYAKSDLDDVNVLRADKYLAAQNIANMLYTSGDLTKIRYKNNTDVDYETLGYTSGNLTSINHYVGGVLQGTTTLSYSGGNLVSAVFVAV